MSKRETLHGWGNFPKAACESFRPEKGRDLRKLLATHPTHLIARGLGRSYGDAALQPEGTVRTERLDHIIAFDRQLGLISVQAGVTLSDLMDIVIPQGWLPATIPGTRHITLGGALACNVHGKNHFREGDFAEHVQSVRIILADGNSVECSPSENSDLFWATAGGMGMTGIIESLTLKLKRIDSLSLETLTYRVDSTEDMLAAFEHYREEADYMVGWIDHMAKGDDIGRGIFEAARHVSAEEGGTPCAEFTSPCTRLSIPFPMPSFLLNRYSMAVYNRFRFRRYSSERKKEYSDFNGFFHPLDSIAHWNRLYGKRGFFQYQCLLPDSPDIAGKLHALLEFLHRNHLFSFLAVLKYHREGQGLLTFSQQGYSLALDFPNTARIRALLPDIDRWVADHGGRVYLAKDALLTPENFYAMYGQKAEEWRSLLNDIDPQSRFTSLMSQRLQWKAAP